MGVAWWWKGALLNQSIVLLFQHTERPSRLVTIVQVKYNYEHVGSLTSMHDTLTV